MEQHAKAELDLLRLVDVREQLQHRGCGHEFGNRGLGSGGERQFHAFDGTGQQLHREQQQRRVRRSSGQCERPILGSRVFPGSEPFVSERIDRQ